MSSVHRWVCATYDVLHFACRVCFATERCSNPLRFHHHASTFTPSHRSCRSDPAPPCPVLWQHLYALILSCTLASTFTPSHRSFQDCTRAAPSPPSHQSCPALWHPPSHHGSRRSCPVLWHAHSHTHYNPFLPSDSSHLIACRRGTVPPSAKKHTGKGVATRYFARG
jgi:hypothetical protein